MQLFSADPKNIKKKLSSKAYNDAGTIAFYYTVLNYLYSVIEESGADKNG